MGWLPAWIAGRTVEPETEEAHQAVLSAIARVEQNLEKLERHQAWAEQVRATTDRRRHRANTIVAAVTLGLSLALSLLLFTPSMAGPPLAPNPGHIGLALVEQANPDAMDAGLLFDASVEHSTTFTLVVSDFGTDHSANPLKVVIYACGRVREDLVLREVNGGKILELKPIDGSHVEYDSRLGERAECRYAISSTTDRQVLVEGVSSATLASRSGDGIMYALPGLTTLALADALGGGTAKPLPKNSTLTVNLDDIRSDFTLTTSVPQLPESGRPSWTTSVNPPTDIPSQYRFTGTLTSERNRIQAGVFASGALIGIAGAALLWLVELVLSRWPSRRAELSMDVKE